MPNSAMFKVVSMRLLSSKQAVPMMIPPAHHVSFRIRKSLALCIVKTFSFPSRT